MLGLETQLSSITIAIGSLYVEQVPTTHLICIDPPHISLYQIYIVVVSYNVIKSCTLKVFKFNKIKLENGKRSSRVPESSLLK